jgi:hypothetical protein
MEIIAFHGDFASPQMLREDIGDIGLPITFMSSTNWLDAISEIDVAFGPKRGLVGIGFSRGCGVIADLSYQYPDLFIAAVLYEGPLGFYGKVGGSFPVLMIWNSHGVKKPSLLKPWHWFKPRVAREAEMAWEEKHSVSYASGTGCHMRYDKTKNPKLRHAWDQSLNKTVREFIVSSASSGSQLS